MMSWKLKSVLSACCFLGSIYFVTPQTSIIETACENESTTINCGTEIVIESATYGSDPAFSSCPGSDLCINVDNVLNDVSDSCDGEVTCTVTGSNTAFDVGDPCPGSFKYLSVTYRCKENEFFRYIIISSGIAAILFFAVVMQAPAEPVVVDLRPPVGLSFA